MSYATFATVVFQTLDGDLEEAGIYTHEFDSWSETIAHAERVLRLRGFNVSRIVLYNGNAA